MLSLHIHIHVQLLKIYSEIVNQLGSEEVIDIHAYTHTSYHVHVQVQSYMTDLLCLLLYPGEL